MGRRARPAAKGCGGLSARWASLNYRQSYWRIFMSRNWMRRGLLALASAFTLLVAACGSGTIESRLQPSRIVAFGDSMSALGNGSDRYTVNDGSSNNWTLELAAR